MQPPPEHRIGDPLPPLSTLRLPTQVTPKNMLQGQLKGADQGSKSRIKSPREPDLGRHHPHRIDVAFMQPALKHQRGPQLPSIGKLRLIPDPTSTSLGQLQGVDSSGPPRGRLKRTREEAPRQEAPEQPYQSAYENRKPASGCSSRNAAPPAHKTVGYDVPSRPAGIPNSQREMSRGQSGRNRHESIQQEAQEQRDRLSYESVQATKRHRSERAAPPTHEKTAYDMPFGPASINPNSHGDMSRGQSERSSGNVWQQVQEQKYQSSYKSVRATERHRSGHAAPPRHNTTGHYVPCDPAGITPNSHREISGGQSERDGHEVLQQEAQEQQYQPFHQIREAARRYPSGPATSEKHGSAGDGVLIPPPDTSIHRDMSEADKKTCLEMRKKHPRVPYKKIEVAINHRHSDVEIERYLGQRKWFEVKWEKLQRERDIRAGNDTAMTRRAAKSRQTESRQ